MGRLTCAISTAQYTEAMCHLDGPDAAQAAAASFRMQASSPCQQTKIQQHSLLSGLPTKQAVFDYCANVNCRAHSVFFLHCPGYIFYDEG